MSDYSKSTNFTTKDTLPTGNSGKIVKGTELDTEFTAIASAVASKADITSPSLLGTPTAPTATSGSNTTQIATTAFVTTAVGTLGTMASQNASAVAITGGTITGGTITGITDLVVADGGTGASTFTANSVVLGNGTSALNGNLVAPGTAKNVLVSNGTTWTSGGLDKLSTASGAAPSYSARAWVNFDLGASTIRASGNVSSVSYVGTAQAAVYFTNAMSDANFAAITNCDSTSSIPNVVAYGTGYVQVYFGYYNGPYVNPSYVSVAVFR